MLAAHLSTVHFDRHLIALPVLCVVHIVTQICGIELPLGLLYGPLLYLAAGKNTSYSISYLHFIPFLAFLFLYMLVIFGSQFNLQWMREVSVVYTKSRVAVAVLSLIGYGFFVVFSKDKNDLLVQNLAKKIGLVYLFSGAAIALIMFGLGVNERFFAPAVPFYILAVLTLIMVMGKASNSVPRLDPTERNPAIQADLARLRESLEVRKLFLNPSLTLELLAKDASMSRMHLSCLIRDHAGTSFYELVAWYRVQYVVTKLSEYDDSTIESLAYESGFNSKTSLNKYFREFTGMTPSELRSAGVGVVVLSPEKILPD